MTNFLHPARSLRHSQWWARWILPRRNLMIILLCIIGIFVIMFSASARAGRIVQKEAAKAKESLMFAQVAIGNQDFDRAGKDFAEAEQHFRDAHAGLGILRWWKILPFFGKQVRTVDDVLAAGIHLVTGFQHLNDIGKEVFAIIDHRAQQATLQDITPAQKRKVLQRLAASPTQVEQAQTDIATAVELLRALPDHGLIRPLRNAIAPIQEQLPLLDALLNQALPIVRSLPVLAGYPDEKTYLFLLQNNRELRPTGGFIGTYGILKVQNGDITSFETDNIYNLDEPAANLISEDAPAPIQRHTTTQNWLLRDANWSPDFPTSARKARDKYLEEGGEERTIHGVIAVTPSFMESLLGVTGPVKVNGTTFTPENAVDILQRHVGVGFAQEGIAVADRKAIVGELGKELLHAVFATPQNRFGDLWNALAASIDQKDILIYVDDVDAQKLVQQEQWGGQLRKTDGDFLMVVDANLAALKTDAVMERQLEYTVTADEQTAQGEVRMHYKNTGTFTQFTTRYRSYTRVILPAGSTLLEYEGFLTGDRLQGGRPTAPEVVDESFSQPDGTTITFTIVAGFIAIEPGEEGSLRIKYRLPEKIREALRDGSYDLLVQKQAGTNGHNLSVDLQLGRSIRRTVGLDLSEQRDNNEVRFTGDLNVDRNINIELED